MEPMDFDAACNGRGVAGAPTPSSETLNADFHAVAPTTRTCVPASTLPSATHARMVARSTGPYSWPSPPMIL